MNKTNRPTILAIVSLLALAALPIYAAEHQHDAGTDKRSDPKPYPLDVCVVSGEKLGGDMGEPLVFVHEGREVKLCCKSCRKDFDADPAKFLTKIDEAAKKVKPYRLDTCIVSGEKLGSMGKPLVFVKDFQEVKLCCKGCVKDFEKNAKEYLAKLKQETAKLPATKPTATHDPADHNH